MNARCGSASDLLFLQRVLAALGEMLTAPSEELPTVRCISRTTLTRSLTAIRDRLAIPGRKAVPAKSLIQQLQRTGLIHPIPVVDPSTGEPLDSLFTIGLGARVASVRPEELLLAREPEGVLCYFTALSYYSLTTQIAPFHHVARLVDWGSRSTAAAAPTTEVSASRSYNPLGTELFVYQGQSYFRTTRDRRLMPGIQSRHLDEKTTLRITTLEQTLLDTLHRPLSCGGPAVVFEAWDQGLPQANQVRLAEYLQRIGDPALVRRVGYFAESLGIQPGEALRQQLEPVRRGLEESAEMIPLIQGFAGPLVDERWRVVLP